MIHVQDAVLPCDHCGEPLPPRWGGRCPKRYFNAFSRDFAFIDTRTLTGCQRRAYDYAIRKRAEVEDAKAISNTAILMSDEAKSFSGILRERLAV